MDFSLPADIFYLGILPPLSTNCIRPFARILLLKLNSTSIRHMILRFDVTIFFPFFFSITFMDFNNTLVNILLCKGYGKGRLQNLKGRETVKIL